MALSRLPLASGQRHKRVFEDLGWVPQSEGNHIVLTHPKHPEVLLSIPNHDEVKKETLKAIIRAARLTDEQYAVFFNGKCTITQAAETDEDLFRERTMPDGSTHIHCMKCCQHLCRSADPEVLAAIKRDHPAQCPGTF